jgi:hypothetical protein
MHALQLWHEIVYVLQIRDRIELRWWTARGGLMSSEREGLLYESKRKKLW